MVSCSHSGTIQRKFNKLIGDHIPSLLLYNALSVPPFRHVKLRSRKPTCPACGTEGQKIGEIRDIDYIQFCGGERPNWESRGLTESGEERIRVKELKEVLDEKKELNLIDVRPKTEFGICSLPKFNRSSCFSLLLDISSKGFRCGIVIPCCQSF
jgi:adenylyltransferase and sulfurtransferase